MMRILIGLAAVVVVAAAGLLGFNLYVQHRATAAIEATFDQLRATGNKASHGKVTVDLMTRTVTMVDISVASAAQPPTQLKIASMVASGVRRTDSARVSADSVELTDLEFATERGNQVPVKVAYTIPRITVKDYSRPSGSAPFPTSQSLLEAYRFALEQFSAVAASSVTIPTATGTVNGGPATPGGAQFAYSGVVVQDVRDGKVASIKVDRSAFTMSQPKNGQLKQLTGNLTNIVANDFDAAPVIAALGLEQSNDDSYHRIYRQLSAGPYVIDSDLGVQMRIDAMNIEDVALRPSKLQLAAILAMVPQPGAPPLSPAQAGAMLDKVAGVYEGIRIGKMEMRGSAIRTPEGPFKLAAIRTNLDNGRGQLVLEGLEVETPKGPVRFERFALKSFDIPQLIRFVARGSGGAKPTPDEIFGLLAAFEGAELKDAATPFRNTNKLVNIDTIDLGWGQFIGSVPSKAHLTAKLNVPVDWTDPVMKPLADAGIDRMAIDVDLGAGWTEGAGAFELAPASLEIGNLLKLSLRASLGNVPREVFTPDAAQAVKQATQIETGTIELRLRDNGSVDVALAQYAFSKSISREAARRAIMDQIKALGEPLVAANPDAAAAVDAAVRFVETPRQTLVIKLTPRAKLPMLELADLLKSAPLIALAQFQIEASTGL